MAWVWHVPCPIGSRVWTLGPQGLQPRWRRGGPWGVPWSFKWHVFPYFLLCVKAKGQLAWVSSPSTMWVPGWNSSCQAWCQVLYLLSCLTDPTGDFVVYLHLLFAFYFFLWLECDWQPRHDGLHPSNYKPKEILPQRVCGQFFFVTTMRSITYTETDTGIGKGFIHLISRCMHKLRVMWTVPLLQSAHVQDAVTTNNAATLFCFSEP